MPIPPLYGHEGTRNRLVGAIASGRLPQALLLEGPRGVGKQRLALWLAQALGCERAGGKAGAEARGGGGGGDPGEGGLEPPGPGGPLGGGSRTPARGGGRGQT